MDVNSSFLKKNIKKVWTLPNLTIFNKMITEAGAASVVESACGSDVLKKSCA
jgi:hypothetical protein